MNSTKNFFALAAALLIPLVIDGALTLVAAKAIPEALLAQAKSSDGKSLAIEDIERITKEVKQAKAARDYQKAIEIEHRILLLKEKRLGVEHPDTADSLNSLGKLYYKKGLYSKAEPLYQRTIAIRGKALGAEHTSTETSLNNLALLYEKQGLYSKAEPFALRSLSIRDKELSTEHPDVRNGLNILATLYQAQQLYNKAMPL